MCFSAEASFTAATILGGIGLGTLKTVKKKRLALLAAVPFMFAMQQLSEGFVWLSIGVELNESLRQISEYFFLLFAFVIWPVWIPLSMWYAETIQSKKIAQAFLLVLGIGVALYNITIALKGAVTINVIGHSLQYSMANPHTVHWELLRAFYTIATIVPFFISSLRLSALYGVLVILSWLAADFLYNETFTSVWCFFAAIMSVAIWAVIWVNQEPENEQNEKA